MGSQDPRILAGEFEEGQNEQYKRQSLVASGGVQVADHPLLEQVLSNLKTPPSLLSLTCNVSEPPGVQGKRLCAGCVGTAWT